ncbi:MAG: 16S rRNA (cytosine(1402)-N(4))-methyltransferase [Eggerthellaceae bacterium]
MDATLGGAGHSSEVAQRLGSDGVLIGIDQDEMALAAAGARLRNLALNTPPQIELLRGNFGNLDELLLEAEIPGVDAFLFDLGVSSPQLDFPSRGFSFKEDSPLDMRMDGQTNRNRSRAHKHLRASELTGDVPRLLRRNGPVASPSLSSSLASTHR